MAFAETGRWLAQAGEVGAQASGPREPDLVRWFDGSLPELDPRQWRLISGSGAVMIAALMLSALANGLVPEVMQQRIAAMEVLRLADPVPERPPGPPLEQQAAAGGGAAADAAPASPSPATAASPAPPQSILRWSVQAIPRRAASDNAGRSAGSGASGSGAGGGGVYDPYAGAAPQRREAPGEQVLSAVPPLPPASAARLAEAARGRLGTWSGLLRCVVTVDTAGRVASAECRHRQGLAIPAGLGARVTGIELGSVARNTRWAVDL